ncbi:PAS domain-containing protein [Syntrophomonas erecta]
MQIPRWIQQLPAAVTVCDQEGIIIYMNEISVGNFSAEGGRHLLGRNLFDCHPEPSRSKLNEMFKNHTPNYYTIEKDGIKKLIVQSPWYENHNFMGFIEMIVETPTKLPHYQR